jgi:hypothetical protein
VKKCKRRAIGRDSGPGEVTLLPTEVLRMKARFSPRLSILSVALVSAVAVAACNNARPTTEATDGQPAAAQEAQVAAPAQHGPGHRLFKQVQALDLRDAQRDAVTEAEQNLAADLGQHHAVFQQVAENMARAVESGRLDPEVATTQQAALLAAAADMRDAVSNAINTVHDTLDADQRAALVARLRAQSWNEHGHADTAGYAGGDPQTPEAAAEAADKQDADMTKLAVQIGLTAEQKQALHETIRDTMEQMFPDRKARREAWEAKMKAVTDAFMTDDFDAADFELAGDAEKGIRQFNEAAQRVVDASGKVLSSTQRYALAALIRERAAAAHH